MTKYLIEFYIKVVSTIYIVTLHDQKTKIKDHKFTF